MRLAVVGATGLVGSEILKVLEERELGITELLPVASSRSVGKSIVFKGKSYKIIDIEQAIQWKPDYALFSAGSSTSLEYAPRFAEVGTVVVDNSSAWRMNPRHKLVVPEINGHLLTEEDKIIANPNCSTIQMVMVLAPLHKKYGIKRVVVSTYQSVTGTGKEAVDQLMQERAGQPGNKVYPHPIDLNVLPHIDIFLENGYTKEEMKMVNETKKIMGDDSIQVTATAVRIPVIGGHAEAVNIEFVEEYTIEEVKDILSNTEGLILQDDVSQNVYPMPIHSHNRDEVFVGRVRRDETQAKSLNLWIVADNLRKGAATNAIQIAELLAKKQVV